MKKLLAMILAIAMTASLLTGCGGKKDDAASSGSSGSSTTTSTQTGTQKPADDKVYTIKLGHVQPDDAATARACVYFKEIIEEKSAGRILVDIYSNSALGSERELTEMLEVGSVQMISVGDCGMGNVIWPELNVLEAPFLFHNQEEVLTAMESDYAAQLVEDIYENTNTYIMGWLYRGGRHLFTKDPVKTPADIKGMKIRVPEVDVYLATFNTLGCNVTPIAYSELYSSLQTGVVDGFEGMYDLTYGNRFYEVVDYCCTIGWCWTFAPLAVSKQFYESLPADLQAILKECVDLACQKNIELTLDSEANLEQSFIDQGVEIYHPNVDDWANLFTEEVIADMASCWNDPNSTDLYYAWQAAAKG